MSQGSQVASGARKAHGLHDRRQSVRVGTKDVFPTEPVIRRSAGVFEIVHLMAVLQNVNNLLLQPIPPQDAT